MKQPRPTVLITGASVGIGYELAKIFARRGYDLVLVARREDKLHQIAATFNEKCSGTTRVLAKDLAQPAAPDEIFRELEAQNVAIDILINNAGFGDLGPFAEADWQVQQEMMQVNTVALAHLTYLFLPGMKARGRGRILNVASTASFLPGPLMSVYYASKAFVLSFSLALSNELENSGVTVTALCPGPTKTDFQATAKMGDSKLTESARMSAATVARAGYRGLMQGRSVVVPGFSNQLVAFMARLLPENLTARIARRAQDTRE